MKVAKTRIRKNDTVQVISGAASGLRSIAAGVQENLRGKRGKVLRVYVEEGRAIVEGINKVYRHQRVQRDPSRPNQGRIEKEAPIKLDNLMLVCPGCKQASRTGIKVVDRKNADGSKIKHKKMRVCKKCGEDIPER